MSFRPSICARTALISASALAMLAFSSSAFAGGTPAGSQITSTASATYLVGGVNDGDPTMRGNVLSNQVTIRVDELIEMTANRLYEVPVSKGTTATISWTLSNVGNGEEAFSLTVEPGDSQMAKGAVTVEQVAFDENRNGIYDPGIDRIFTVSGDTRTFVTSRLLPDTDIRIIATIKHNLSATPQEADWKNLTAEINMMATAVTGKGKAGTVFSGAGDLGTDAVMGVSAGELTSTNLITITDIANASDITLQKTAKVSNQFGGIQAIPGATITYTIKTYISKGAAANFVISNPIPSNTVYQDGTLKYGSNDFYDAQGNGPDGVTAEILPDKIIVNFAKVSATQVPKDISFDVKVK